MPRVVVAGYLLHDRELTWGMLVLASVSGGVAAVGGAMLTELITSVPHGSTRLAVADRLLAEPDAREG